MKKQVKQEAVKEEEIVVENKEESEYVAVDEPIVEPISYETKSLEEIELERQKFFKTFSVQNTLKWVISLICIAAIVVGCIVIPNLQLNNDSLKTGLMLGIVFVALAGTLGYSVFTKRSMNSRMRKYFSFYYKKINEYAFDQDGFKNPVLQEPGKIDLDLFRDMNLYKDVIDVGSRGLTEFEYNGIPMRIVECAGNIKAEKRMRPVFVGKMIHCAASYLGEQSIVIYFKGNEKALPPTNVNELKVIEDNTKYIIYSNSGDAKKVINAKVKKLLDGIKMNKYLIDLAISIHDGKIYACLGYDDPLMILPLQKQFDPKPNEQYKKDLGEIIKVLEAFNK